MKFTNSCFLCYILNLVKIGLVVLEKKMLTDNAQRTPHDDGRQPIAIGHLRGQKKMCEKYPNINKFFQVIINNKDYFS